MTTDEHHCKASGTLARCAVLTISDTRTEANDSSGRFIRDSLGVAGHSVAAYQIVKDDPEAIERQLRTWTSDSDVQVICCTGGTGIAPRDSTIEVAERLIGKKLDGFGELFRMLSWKEIGAAAMLSRAVAGLAEETMLFVMPGSTNAVRLAMHKLIIPELSHLIWVRSA